MKRLLFLAFTLLTIFGCVHPLDGAIKATNAAARALSLTHAALSAAYRQEQLAAIEAAADPDADMGAPDAAEAAEEAQRAREAVGIVRTRWAPAWRAYELAQASWQAASTLLVDALAPEGAPPDLPKITSAILALTRATLSAVTAAKALTP